MSTTEGLIARSAKAGQTTEKGKHRKQKHKNSNNNRQNTNNNPHKQQPVAHYSSTNSTTAKQQQKTESKSNKSNEKPVKSGKSDTNKRKNSTQQETPAPSSNNSKQQKQYKHFGRSKAARVRERANPEQLRPRCVDPKGGGKREEEECLPGILVGYRLNLSQLVEVKGYRL